MFNINLAEAKANFASLTYKGKKLIADIFGRAKFTYVAEVESNESVLLSGLLKINGKEFSLSEVDEIFEGPPPGFIKGQFLYFIGSEVSYRSLKSLPRTINRAELDELVADEDPEVIILGAEKFQGERPCLVLLDPFGVTARLTSQTGEEDLKLTSYRKKGYEWTSPSDKVFDSLALLWAGGWLIETRAGQELIPFENLDLDWSFSSKGTETLQLTGAAQFHGESVPLDKVLKERIIPLPSGKVGLLPPNFKLHKLPSLTLPKNRLGEVMALVGEKSVMAPRDNFFPRQNCPPSPLFQGSLRPYQQEGLDWLWFLYQNGFSGLLADEMGLGKTVQTLAFLSLLPPNSPILIVMPTTLTFNWLAEIRRFLPGREQSIKLISYVRLRLDCEELKKTTWEALLLDEAQMIKNSDSQTFKAACSLPTKFRLSLTGTPIENRLTDLVSHFKFLQPDLELAEEAELLKKRTAPFILRRKKDQVLKDLPDKVEETVFVDLSEEQKGYYDNYLREAKEGDLSQKNSLEILEVILRLRQIACHPLLAGIESSASAKMEAVLADIETLLAEGKKVILFSQFTSMLTLIKKSLSERGITPLYLDGETKDRQTPVEKFQNDPSELLFLMSLKAGGVGLNLTAADWILLFDPWWNTAVEDQAIARAHRIGRKSTVFTKRYIARGTLEEKIEELKQSKKKLAEDLFSESVSDYGEEILKLL